MMEEEEGVRILEELFLERGDTADSIKLNSRQFYKLIQAEDAQAIDPHGNDKKCTVDNDQSNQLLQQKKIELKESKSAIKNLVNTAKFIERNIQLAKCGNGVLSLTDDEKVHLNRILKDTNSESQGESTANGNQSEDAAEECHNVNWFTLDSRTKKELDFINNRLEIYDIVKKSECFPEVKLSSAPEPQTPNSEHTNSTEEASDKKKFMGQQTRLRELDREITNINAPVDEEVVGPNEEQIKQLVQEAVYWEEEFPKIAKQKIKRSTRGYCISIARPSQAVIGELLNHANSQLTNFKPNHKT